LLCVEHIGINWVSGISPLTMSISNFRSCILSIVFLDMKNLSLKNWLQA